MAKVYLGLGSNMGNTRENIDNAIKILGQHDRIKIVKKSSYYETEPVGYKDQEWFLNRVVQIDTTLSPYDLLLYCHFIENQLKRKRIIRWGPRTIDVDILLYEDFISDDEKLTIPHPRMLERAFVMIPLYEIAPCQEINGQKIKEIMENFKGEEIRKL